MPNSHELRRQLGRAVVAEIGRRRWTQTQAAVFLNTTQSRISDLMKGHADRIRLDVLINWLEALGHEVCLELKYSQARPGRRTPEEWYDEILQRLETENTPYVALVYARSLVLDYPNYAPGRQLLKEIHQRVERYLDEQQESRRLAQVGQ